MTGLFDEGSGTPPPTRVRAAWWVEAVLLLVATACLGWFGYNWIASEADQLWSNYALDAQLDGRKPSLTGFLNHIRGREEPAAEEAKSPTEGQPVDDPGERPRPTHVPRGTNIGRIEIPRLKITSIVRQGVDDKTLSRAVGHVPYTALPGQPGNVGLAAHRDTYFRNLRDVREGDTIRVVTTDGAWEYVVDSLQIVTPKNVEVLDPTPHPALTLVTCYPFNYVGHAPKRFIVRARQKDVPPEPKRGA